MSIKALALELYRAQQKVDEIRDSIGKATYEQQERLKEEMRVAKQEHRMLRKMLDGRKESGSFNKKFGQFSSFK